MKSEYEQLNEQRLRIEGEIHILEDKVDLLRLAWNGVMNAMKNLSEQNDGRWLLLRVEDKRRADRV